MKKILNTSIIYFVLGIAAGVFYRELTKFHGYTGNTALSAVHPHFFVLGMFLFLMVAFLCRKEETLLQNVTFRRFFILYNISLPFMACTMLARGIIQVMEITLSKSMNAMVSGIAGVSHILITVCLVLLFISLKKALVSEEN